MFRYVLTSSRGKRGADPSTVDDERAGTTVIPKVRETTKEECPDEYAKGAPTFTERLSKAPFVLMRRRIRQERKYFDSGDYAMHKAGVGAEMPVGSAIATPER